MRFLAAMVVALAAGCASAPGGDVKDPHDGVPSTGSAGAGEAGSKAPDFELPTLDGGHASLAQFRGKVVLIDFWSTICDPCLQEMPELVKLYQARKDQGFVVLAIATDGPETEANVSSVAKAKNMIFPVLLDKETAVLDRYDPEGRLPF